MNDVKDFLEELDVMLVKARIVDSLDSESKNLAKKKVMKLLLEKTKELEADGVDKNFIALEEIKLFIKNNFRV